MAHRSNIQQIADRSSPRAVAQSAQTSYRISTPLLLQRAHADPSSLTATDVKHLQRTVGNRATIGILSRHTGLQAKLKLGPAGDQYEQEADRVAQQVVRQMESPQAVQRQGEEEEELQMKPLTGTISTLQRKVEPRPKMVFTKNMFAQRQEDEEELQMKPLHGPEGGSVEQSVEKQIQTARGGGKPLDDNIRGSMEQGFGADFSGVRVHTGSQADALNRSLNAKAFTVGNDVFFGKGQYNPGSSAGKQLLAHELTHTVQQGGASVQRSREVIQRKVGLELEVSGWQTWQPKSFHHSIEAAMNDPDKRKPFAKGVTLLKKQGYELQADELEGGGSDMEFVTKPFEETDQTGLQTALQSIYDLCKGMQQRMLQKGSTDISFASAMKGNGKPKTRGFFKSNGIIVFKPQATGGIKLEALGGMMKDIGAPQGGENVQDTQRLQPGREALMSMPTVASGNAPGEGILRVGSAGPEAQAAITAYLNLNGVAANVQNALGNNWQGSARLKGLLALIITYIEAARYPLPNYAKAIAPIMARTDFAAMFNQLPDNERAYFSNNNGAELVRLVEQVPMFGNPVQLGNGVTIPAVNMNQPLFEGGIYHSQAMFNHGILDALTRQLWLSGMTQGTDYLTRKHIAATGAGNAAKEQIESLGSLGNKTEQVGIHNARTNAPIFELRGMDKVDLQDLVTWGVNVLRYFRAVNYGVNAKFGE